MRYDEIIMIEEDFQIMERAALDDLDVQVDARGYAFNAYVGKKNVGRLMLSYTPGKGQPENSRYPMGSVVDSQWRGKGVGYALYKAVRGYLEEKGMELWPSPEALSDDAYNFWKKFDPEKVKWDGRVILDQYVNREFTHNGRTWTVGGFSPGWTGAFIKEVGTSATNSIKSQTIFDQLGEPVIPDWAK